MLFDMSVEPPGDDSRAHRVEQAARRYGIVLTEPRERMFLRLVAAQGLILARQPRGDVLYLVRHLARWVLICVDERQQRIRTFLPLGPGAWVQVRNGERLPVEMVVETVLRRHKQALRAPLRPPAPAESAGAYRARIQGAVTARIHRCAVSRAGRRQ